MVEETIAYFKKIDILVNNAGTVHEDPKMRAHIPLGRVGDVREIGLLAVSLASPV